MFEIYKTYSKVKDVFVKPKMKFHFGRWYMLPGLPVWRRGPEICLDRYGRNSYTPNNSSYICVGKKGDVIDGKELKYDRYKTSFHKLPKGTEYGAWTRPIRQKLRKMGLGWIKPRFFLPIWFTVDCFCYDVIYKWKYDEIRYEYPPQFTIVLFGLAITVQLIPDPVDDTDCPDHYWESLLSYLYQEECDKDIKKTLSYCGQWTQHTPEGEKKYFQLKKGHLQEKYHKEYDEAIKEYKEREICSF